MLNPDYTNAETLIKWCDKYATDVKLTGNELTIVHKVLPYDDPRDPISISTVTLFKKDIPKFKGYEGDDDE